jgi:16S rRNA U516 pseudouridylate synthase RsuA-like enzyme
MTAAVGHPTLRLLRERIGPIELDGLSPGEWQPLTDGERDALRASLSAAGSSSRRESGRPRPGRRSRG